MFVVLHMFVFAGIYRYLKCDSCQYFAGMLIHFRFGENLALCILLGPIFRQSHAKVMTYDSFPFQIFSSKKLGKGSICQEPYSRLTATTCTCTFYGLARSMYVCGVAYTFVFAGTGIWNAIVANVWRNVDSFPFRQEFWHYAFVLFLFLGKVMQFFSWF